VARELIGIEEARRRVLAHVVELPEQAVPLGEALDRVLASDAIAPHDVPGFDNSSMDGFALRARDTSAAPVVLTVLGESSAGHPASVEVGPGQAVRISTGAMLPAGADAIVRFEDTREQRGHQVEVEVAVPPGTDIRRSGEDVRAGAVIIGRGTRLGPAELGVLASLGVDPVPCVTRPRVAVLTSGDELVSPGQPLPPGTIYDTSRFAVAGQAHRAGAPVIATSTLPDDRGATVRMLREVLDADVVVICGGVSVGAHDHVKSALTEIGVHEVFWGVAMRPGKPTWFGVLERSGSRTLVFGLPGNPVSAMVTFHLFAQIALGALQGLAPAEVRTVAVIDENYAKAPGRAHVVRCRAEAREDGWHVKPTGPQGSHVLTSMLGADALAFLPAAQGPVSAGERVVIELIDRG
jgi:molybdopterin molybdotransferase